MDPLSDDEPRAWAQVLAAWEDDGAHRAYLERFCDLDGLARAGARYREALAARPDDPVAGRWRDAVVRRAMAAGLAALPRTKPARWRVPRFVRPGVLVAVGALLASLAWALFRAISSSAGGTP